jgi:hypothetical protein
MRPWSLILIGFLLSVAGVVLPFLMLIHTIPSTFFLNFFSYFSSFSGLVFGIVGASLYVQKHRK